MRSHLLLAFSAAALLAGCAGANPLQRTLPDETQVLSGPNLALPPSFELRPPREGEAPPPPVVRSARGVTVSGTAPAEAWLLREAQSQTGTIANPNIRAELEEAAQAPAAQEDNRGLLQRWFGRE